MNERFATWVIVSGDTVTSFRSRDRDDLIPTLKQLQRKDPEATLKFFARGKLWDSDVQAREDLMAARQSKRTRNDAWRPGGKHADPRARFEISRDEKRARYKKRLIGRSTASSVGRPTGFRGKKREE